MQEKTVSRHAPRFSRERATDRAALRTENNCATHISHPRRDGRFRALTAQMELRHWAACTPNGVHVDDSHPRQRQQTASAVMAANGCWPLAPHHLAFSHVGLAACLVGEEAMASASTRVLIRRACQASVGSTMVHVHLMFSQQPLRPQRV